MEEACFTRAVIKGIKVHFPLAEGWEWALFGIAAGVAPCRRHDTQSDNSLLPIPIHFPATGNAYG